MRISVLDWRMARTSLIVSDLLHHHLLVVRSTLRVAVHTWGAVGIGVVAEGVGPVGTGGVSWWGIAWRG